MVKVTVFLTSYNHGKFISRTIDSILKQTFQDFNMIIVDDGSNDESWEIIKEYQKRDSRIHAIKHRVNLGKSAIDELYPLFDCEYIAMAHSDDIWELDKLEKQVSIMEQNNNVGACFTQVQLINENDEKFIDANHQYYSIFKQENRTRQQWLRYFFDNSNCLCHPSVLIKKELYKDYYLRPVGLSGFPDFYRWVEVCLKYEIYVLQEELVCFRIREDSLKQDSGESEGKMNQLFIEQFLLLHEFFKITDKKDIIEVFPEAEELLRCEGLISEFVIAKMMLMGPTSMHKLVGLEKIYQLLHDDSMFQKLNRVYNYGNKEYSLDKQKYDVFNLIDESRHLLVSLYFGYGEVYLQDNCVSKKFYVDSRGISNITFEIPKNIDLKEVKSIRLDPDEGRFRAFKILAHNLDDLKPVNAVTSEGIDYFFTADPQYEITGSIPEIIIISFECAFIDNNEVAKHFNSRIQELEQELEEKNTSIFKKIVRKLKKDN